MDISSIGGNGPYRSQSVVPQNASPAGAAAGSSDVVTKANQAEVAAEQPLPVLGAPDVERDEDRKQTSESAPARRELTREEKDVVEQLKRVDREVRAHEQAHLSVAGAYATGGASYEYTTGPDGVAYAVAGRLVAVVGEATPPVSHQIHVTMSASYAACPDHGDGVETLYGVADQGLLRAKRTGRNRVVRPEAAASA